MATQLGSARTVVDESLTCLLELDGTCYRLWEFSKHFLEKAFFSPPVR